ncbi:MAG: nucleotidyltransferase [Luteolibacter sp.]
MDNLNPDFLGFIELLEAEHVDYLIVGGYAVGLHGFPRYTGNIDFFVEISNENAAKILRVFEKFGFGEIGLTLGDFLEKDFVVEIGREPRKIQVLTGIDGVRFNECFERKVEVEIAKVKMKFISKKDLMRNKAASGRPKDRIDLEELEKL